MKEADARVLIIIPAFNEEESIGGVIASIHENMPEADIVVVNDGSSDSTRSVAEALGVTVLNLPYNLGIGATMQTGYKYAERNGYDIAVQVDADGQHPADQLKKVIAPANQYERLNLTPSTVVTAKATSATGTRKANLPKR
jgi:hypothetical protein